MCYYESNIIDEELINNAIIIIVRDSDRVSASTLQRKLKIGYARALKLITELEERGIIEKSNNSVSQTDENVSSIVSEELINNAIIVVREKGIASSSILQRNLKIGYARASRLMDALEKMGIIEKSNTVQRKVMY